MIYYLYIIITSTRYNILSILLKLNEFPKGITPRIAGSAGAGVQG
jgi:hypothetical protein